MNFSISWPQRAGGCGKYCRSGLLQKEPLLLFHISVCRQFSADKLRAAGRKRLAKLDHARLAGLSGPTDKIEAEQVLQQSATAVCSSQQLSRACIRTCAIQIDNFCEQNKWWLEDFVLFDAQKPIRRAELEPLASAPGAARS
jgi:hypothetical protein